MIPSGVYRPLYREDSLARTVPVRDFYMDAAPATNGEFLEFVESNPQWKRSKVRRLFADSTYLEHWKSDAVPGSSAPDDAPVVNVSWFAAKAFAAWKGKRLPTIAEWEYAAGASDSAAYGYDDPKFVRKILEWYALPNPAVFPPVRRSRPNYFGLYDCHTLIWEWTSDFNTVLVTGDTRGDTGLERDLFCGAGSLRSSDFRDYAAFMRFGLRASLQARYTVRNLGFRCAKDAG